MFYLSALHSRVKEIRVGFRFIFRWFHFKCFRDKKWFANKTEIFF